MEKILVVFNEVATPRRVLDFTIHTAKETSSPVQCIYLKELSTERFKYPFPNDLKLAEGEQTEVTAKEKNSQEETHIEDNFEAQLKASGITLEAEKGLSIHDLTEASATADLVIADAKIELKEAALNNMLSKMQCPVCLIGLNAPAVEKVVLLYDKSDASTYAIKKWSALFPHHKSIPAVVVSVNTADADKQADEAFFSQWLPHHFEHLTVNNLEGNVKEEIVALFEGHDKNVMVVMGAFGRSALSRFFHPSLASTLIDETKVSFFLAHE
jgi:hypothetical protein